AMLGAAAGILLGLVLFGNLGWRRFKRPLQWLALAASIACLALTGARTFWVGAFVAVAATSWFYLEYRLRTYMVIFALALVAGLVAAVAQVQFSSAAQQKILRTESISNLTGRTEVWAEALKRVAREPWLGYGFGSGGYGVATDYTKTNLT